MNTILTLDQIKPLLSNVDLIAAMEEGFIQYSNGNCVVPPVGELLFEKHNGETHIKYGYIKDDDQYVIKIASGFYNNPKLGLSSCQGMMLLFDQKTGQPVSILLDNGYLTDLRTAAAGALAAKYLHTGRSAIGVFKKGNKLQKRMGLGTNFGACQSIYKRKEIRLEHPICSKYHRLSPSM